MDKEIKAQQDQDKARKEGNHCIALGVGVGGLGTAAALTLGATCPICFVVAPALVGVGLYHRYGARKDSHKKELNQD